MIRPKDIERFWMGVQRGEPHECWPWQKYRDRRGYGVFALARKTWQAHRVAYTIAKGPIPPGYKQPRIVVMHSCDNRACCNPSHLSVGTQADNVRDMMLKGRGVAVSHTAEVRAEISRKVAEGLARRKAAGGRIGKNPICVGARKDAVAELWFGRPDMTADEIAKAIGISESAIRNSLGKRGAAGATGRMGNGSHPDRPTGGKARRRLGDIP